MSEPAKSETPAPAPTPAQEMDLSEEFLSGGFHPGMRDLSAYVGLLVAAAVLGWVLLLAEDTMNRRAAAFLALVMAALNYFWWEERWGPKSASGKRALAFVVMGADIALVTILIYLTGGADSPFFAAYFPFIVFVSVFFTLPEAFVITGLLCAWYLAVAFLAAEDGLAAMKAAFARTPFVFLTTWFSGEVAAELERRRRRQARSIRQFRTIAEIGEIALSALDLEPLLRPMLDKTLALVSARAGAILLTDSDGRLRVAAETGFAVEEAQRALLADPAVQAALRGEEPAAEAGGAALRLQCGGSMFGVLYVSSPAAQNGEAAGTVLSAAANQIAMALQNAWKHQTAVRAHRRESLLLRLVGSASVTQDLPSLLQTLLEQTSGGLAAESAMLTLETPGRDELRIAAVSGTLVGRSDLPKTMFAGAGVHGQAIARGEPVRMDPNAASPLSDVLLERLGVRCALAAPIQVEDKIIGAISVHDKRGEGGFTKEDEDLLEAIAKRAAVAIQNARLYDQANQRVSELQSLYRLAESVVRNRTLPPTFELAVSSVTETLGARSAHLWMQGRVRTQVVCVAASDSRTDQLGRVVEDLDEELSQRLFGRAHRFGPEDIAALKETLAIPEGTRSLVCAPLSVEGEPLGLLCVEAPEPDAFTDDDLRLASMFADLLAMAVRSDRLLRAMRRNAEEIRALFEAVESMSATNAIDEILDFVAHRMRSSFPCDWCAVRLVNEETGELVVAAEEGDQDASAYAGGDGVVTAAECWAIRKDKAFLVRDVREEFHCRPVRDHSPARSYLCAPLTAGGKTFGVLQMTARGERSFEPEHVQLFMALADQAAIAVQRAKLHEEVERLAVRDGLTGLYNYSYFHEQLSLELTRSKRTKEPMSLLILDIDHFKSFNDTYGHPTGDALLRRLAEVMQSSVRSVDLCARMGGEEFAVLLSNTDKEGALKVAEKLRAAVQDTPFAGDASQPVVEVTVSIGVASAPEDADKKDVLIRRADDALYRAKAEGRNRVVAA